MWVVLMWGLMAWVRVLLIKNMWYRGLAMDRIKIRIRINIVNYAKDRTLIIVHRKCINILYPKVNHPTTSMITTITTIWMTAKIKYNSHPSSTNATGILLHIVLKIMQVFQFQNKSNKISINNNLYPSKIKNLKLKNNQL